MKLVLIQCTLAKMSCDLLLQITNCKIFTANSLYLPGWQRQREAGCLGNKHRMQFPFQWPCFLQQQHCLYLPRVHSFLHVREPLSQAVEVCVVGILHL